MAVVKTAVYQVVGFQNSGKTTMILTLIEKLNKAGLKTATIKHHGHGGKPETAENKDSSRQIGAGAIASAVEGGGRLVLQADHFEGSLEDQLALLQAFKPNVILIEGHKWEHYPKFLLVKCREELSLLEKLENVRAVLYWEAGLKEDIEKTGDIPSFLIDSPEAVEWIVGHILQDLKIN